MLNYVLNLISILSEFYYIFILAVEKLYVNEF